MADIDDKIRQIREAVYGKEVRESIAGSIEAVNQEVSVLDATFEQLIINAGDSNAEIVAARVDAEGTAYPTLGDRLNNIDAHLQTIATINAADYGFLANGTDETSKIASMLANMPASGAKIVFDKNKQITVNGTSQLVINDKKNVVIEGLNVTGTSQNLFIISGGSEHITFRDCYFHNVNQVILLFDCQNITVENCVFDHTGYGVIQQLGYVSNNVLVINNVAKNMSCDFVEANCTSVAPSKNWIVANNRFLGSESYPNPQTESRFVGFTAVENVIISGNIVEKCAGDAAIHLEDILGEYIIINNIFDNCLYSGANQGYIYLLHSDKDCIISNNIFRRTDASLPHAYALDVASGVYSHSIVFSSNVIEGTAITNGYNLSGINLKFENGDKGIKISNNIFRNCQYGINHNAANDIEVIGNLFVLSKYGIYNSVTSTSNGGSNWIVINNIFKDIESEIGIHAESNTNGTNPPKKWFIQGNYMNDNQILLSTIGLPIEDIAVINNYFNGGKELLQLTGSHTRLKVYGNIFTSLTGLQPFVNTSISEPPTFVGEIAVVSGIAYIAVGTSTTDDWKQITN